MKSQAKIKTKGEVKSNSMPESQQGQSINTLLQDMAFKTNELLAMGNISQAKMLIDWAAEMYEDGEEQVRSLVSNVYVFSVATHIELQGTHLLELLPQSFKNEFAGAKTK